MLVLSRYIFFPAVLIILLLSINPLLAQVLKQDKKMLIDFHITHGSGNQSYTASPPFDINEVYSESISSDSTSVFLVKNTFNLTSKQLDSDFIYLNLKGIHTYATISLNDQVILTTDNAFKTYKVPLKGLVRNINYLTIKLTSQPQNQDTWGAENNHFILTNPKNHTRDNQSIESSSHLGISGNIFLSFEKELSIQENSISNFIENNQGRVKSKIILLSNNPTSYTIQQRLDKRRITTWEVIDSVINQDIKAKKPYTFQTDYTVQNPYIYSPSIYENTKLRLVTDIYKNGELLSQHNQPIYFQVYYISDNKQRGDNTPRLYSQNFQYFIKGVNWEGISPFAKKENNTEYRILFDLLKKLQVNFTRVTADSYYEKDIFYHLSDSLDLYVWQDFMFSHGIYPATEVFINNVKSELSQQLQGLNYHPSVIAFSGNEGTDDLLNSTEFQKKYSRIDLVNITAAQNRLFKDIIPNIVETQSPHKFYKSSISTSRNSQNNDSDIFCSEKSTENISQVNLKVPDPQSLDFRYGVKSLNDLNNNSDVQVYISQLNQALKTSMFIQKSRSKISRNSGIFINKFYESEDVTSSALLNSDKSPKLAFYQVSRDYESLSINYNVASSTAWTLVSDYNEPFSSNLTVYEVNPKNGKVKTLYDQEHFELDPLETIDLSIRLPKLLKVDPSNLIVIDMEHGNNIIRNTYTISKQLQDIRLPRSNNISIVSRNTDDGIELTIKSNGLNPWTQLKSSKSGYFSDNFITILPGEEKIVHFYPFHASDDVNNIEFRYISYTTEFLGM